MIRKRYNKGNKFDKNELLKFIHSLAENNFNETMWYVNETDRDFEIVLHETFENTFKEICKFCEENDGIIFIEPSQEIDPDILLMELKSVKIKNLLINTKIFIETVPNGFPRYDVDLKLNIIYYKQKFEKMLSDNLDEQIILRIQNKLLLIHLVEEWINRIQFEFFSKKELILSAKTVSELNDIDISVQWFEIRYGTNGTILQDINLKTEDLILFNVEI